MALTIADRIVEEKAIKAGYILGVDKTEAVEIALDHYLRYHPDEHKKEGIRRDVSRLFDELPALPILDKREPDEILGYGKNGLP